MTVAACMTRQPIVMPGSGLVNQQLKLTELGTTGPEPSTLHGIVK